MKEGDKAFKIDESVKVSSWAADFQQDPSRQAFQKYAQSPKSAALEPEEARKFTGEDSQSNVESGFRKLKNEQIEKLKDLRSEYEEIRKIATDYAAPRNSRTPSENSSSRSLSLAPPAPREGGPRELQILELEKRQLEIMVENSMKKIEELLHNEMGYKKTIHELRLAKDTRASPDLDQEGLTKLLKKKEREHTERVKLLELEREALLGSLAGARDRVKYLEGSLTASEQELRRLLDEKRNFEEQLRLERDRFMSLEIELRRERREHEISEKDKTAEINRLLKLRDVRENASDRELKNAVAGLQEEVKVKEERYRILLEKFEGYQREQKERQERERENEAKVVSELLSKSSSPDPQSRLLQETIAGILTRLNDLEKKPIVEIDHIVNHEHEEHAEVVERLETKINLLSKQLQEKSQQVIDLEAQNYQLKANAEKLEREIKRLSEREAENAEEVERLKKLERTFKKDKSMERFVEYRTKPDSPTNAQPGGNQQIILLESRLALLTKENEALAEEKAALEEEDRHLRLSVSRLEFEVEKGAKERAFALSLQEKAYEKRLEDLNAANAELKSQVGQLNRELASARQEATAALSLKAQENQQLTQALQALRRERSSADQTMKQNINNSVNRLRSENSVKLSDLTTSIQQLTAENQRLQEERQEWLLALQENERLVQMLRRMRYMSGECDRLWSAKEQEYERIDQLLRAIPK